MKSYKFIFKKKEYHIILKDQKIYFIKNECYFENKELSLLNKILQKDGLNLIQNIDQTFYFAGKKLKVNQNDNIYVIEKLED